MLISTPALTITPPDAPTLAILQADLASWKALAASLQSQTQSTNALVRLPLFHPSLRSLTLVLPGPFRLPVLPFRPLAPVHHRGP